MRFDNHTKSFRHERYELDSELSKHIWKLKRNEVDFSIHFKRLAFAKPFTPEAGKCQMCVKEKLEIIKNLRVNKAKAINRRDEVFRKCLHRGKYLLGSINTRKKTVCANVETEGRGETLEERDRGPDFGLGGIGVVRQEGSLEEGVEGDRLWGHTRSGASWRN